MRNIACGLRPERHIGSLRLIKIDHRRQRLIVDIDEVSGVHGLRNSLRDHHGDRLANMHHALSCEHLAHGRHRHFSANPGERDRRRHRTVAKVRKVRACQHTHNAGRRQRARSVDAANERMGVRRTHEHSLQRALKTMIVAIVAFTAQQGAVFVTPAPCPDRFVENVHAACPISYNFVSASPSRRRTRPYGR